MVPKFVLQGKGEIVLFIAISLTKNAIRNCKR